jgi:hypothetical protein
VLPVLALSWLPRPALGLTESPGLSLTLGTTTVTVAGSALDGLSRFDLGPPGMGVSTASATARNPYREVTLTEVSYGQSDIDDPALGVAVPGRAAGARASLQAFRASQHASPLGRPAADLLGTRVVGDANLVRLQVQGSTPTPTVVVEWVTEAGGALWLIRTAEGVTGPATPAQIGSILARVSDLSVTAGAPSGTPAVFLPSIAGMASDTVQTYSGTPPPPVPTPSWWSGVCDTNNYSAAAQALLGHPIAAYPLSVGAEWDGLIACGPRPYYNEGPDVNVDFPGAQWGVLEWECVELSMRWMYLEWHVQPYPANGSSVVWNYAPYRATYNPGGPALQAIPNEGSGILPQPGDVLSYGATSTAGHTSVVTAVNVDDNGNGSVTVLEENASSTGWDTVSVSSWVLGGFDGGVTGWLHNPGSRGGLRALPPAPGRARAMPPA